MRTLLGGHIDLNVVDGSAFFMTSVASLMAGRFTVDVDLLSAKPLQSEIVTSEILGHPGIEILDPAKEFDLSASERVRELRYGVSEAVTAERIATTAARGGYDAVFIRGTRVAFIAATEHGLPTESLVVYVTGFTHTDVLPDEESVLALQGLAEQGALLVFQTKAMARWCDQQFLRTSHRYRSAVLMPSVPVQETGLRAGEKDRTQGPELQAVYLGKFFPDWAPIEQIMAIREARHMGADVELVVVGDHFGRSAHDPRFEKNVRYLLESTEGVDWLGALPRGGIPKLLAKAQVGLSLRTAAMNTSLEFSTKVLEYSAAGLAVILNRTEMHEEILGSDYPMFANSSLELAHLLHQASQNPRILEEASERCKALAKRYSTASAALDVGEILARAVCGDDFFEERVGGQYFGAGDNRPLVAIDPVDEVALFQAWQTGSLGRSTMLSSPLLDASRTGDRPVAADPSYQDIFNAGAKDILAQTARAMSADILSTLRQHSGVGSQKLPQAVSESAKREAAREKELLAEIDHLNAQLGQSRQSVRELQARLNALRASKLGKLQRKIWSIRKSTRKSAS